MLGLDLCTAVTICYDLTIRVSLGQVCGGIFCEGLGYPALMLGSDVFSATTVYVLWGFAHTSRMIYLFSVVLGLFHVALRSFLRLTNRTNLEWGFQ